MKSLVVDDDSFSRRILQTIFLGFGECHIAEDGQKGLSAFEQALVEKSPYDAICLDIMMPEMDGQEVLRKIRKYESEKGVADGDSVKVIMTTALSDNENINQAFIDGCEAYLVKPISKSKIIETLADFDLIE